jgi:hypothetical protein
MSDLETRVAALEARLDGLEPHIQRTIPIGPGPRSDQESEERQRRIMEKLVKDLPPVDRNNIQLTDGSHVPEDRSHVELKDNGQQKGYVVLSPVERAKGFVRPLRRSYRHVGPGGPQHPLRDLTEVEQGRYSQFGYAKYEEYPKGESTALGKFWTQEELDRATKRCGVVTTMASSIAETYARDPKFYGGTFCMGCGKHYPVGEFVWEGTDEKVGS